MLERLASLKQINVVYIYSVYKEKMWRYSTLKATSTISDESCGYTATQNKFHQYCKKLVKCLQPWFAVTVLVTESNDCNQGLELPIKCIILTPLPYLENTNKYFNETDRKTFQIKPRQQFCSRATDVGNTSNVGL